MKKSYEIEKNLVISAFHFKEDTLKTLMEFNTLIVDEFDFGYRVMREENCYPELIPKELDKLLKVVNKKKLTWLIIDIDGPVYPWLKIYKDD